MRTRPRSGLPVVVASLLLVSLAVALPTDASPVNACVLPAGMERCTFLCTTSAVAVTVLGAQGQAQARCGSDAAACTPPPGQHACTDAARSSALLDWVGVCTANGRQGLVVCGSA